MTRISDSLRGLANRAPLDGATVSVEVTASRVKRRRRVRTGANAGLGAGAAAVAVFALLQPALGSSPASLDLAGAGERDQAAAEAQGYDSATMPPWGVCSTPFSNDAITVGTSLSIVAPSGELQGGETVALQTSLFSEAGGTYFSYGPGALVLWNGIVVGTGAVTGEGSTVVVESGQNLDRATDLALNNCFDGSPLPAGTYTVVAYEDLYTAASDGGGELFDPVVPSEGAAPSVSASTSAVPVEPDQTVSSDGEAGSDGSGVGPAADGEMTRVISAGVEFTIAGDAVENPFEQYLGGGLPDGYLDPATARELFSQFVTAEPWDMAAGTQRVLKTNDSAEAYDESAWQRNFYGCVWDSSAGTQFPETSAEWPLLDITADAPSRVEVSYGWVIDGNPLVTLAVENTSEYTLPGFYGQPSSALYLVKDGVVVAEMYLPSVDPSGAVMVSETGALEPGASVKGQFLWRDLNGCYTEAGQLSVQPGEYTLLHMQNVYLDSSGGGIVTTYMAEGAASVSSDPRPAEPVAEDASSMVEPGIVYSVGDWVELQVWTSLGEISLG